MAGSSSFAPNSTSWGAHLGSLVVILMLCSLWVEVSAGQTITKSYSFENFDGSQVDLEIRIPQEVYINSLKDWTEYMGGKLYSDPKEEYRNFVKGLFFEQKPKTRFLYDAFARGLNGVSDEFLLQTMVSIRSEYPL